jgi:hypothetical protein
MSETISQRAASMTRRIAAFLIALLAAVAPAHAVALLNNIVISAPVSGGTGPVMQYRSQGAFPANMAVQGTFTYGSGGTTVDAWLQTSLDGGVTWTDVCNFHFAQASARFIFNLSSLTPVTTQYTPGDGALGANTAKDGVFGSQWRIKYNSAGTYAGNTTLRVDVISSSGLTQ